MRRKRKRVGGLTFGRPKCVGDLKEVMASVSAPTSFTRMLFILSSLPVSIYLMDEFGEKKRRARSLPLGKYESRSYPPYLQLQ
jgi:hypothetical protein